MIGLFLILRFGDLTIFSVTQSLNHQITRWLDGPILLSEETTMDSSAELNTHTQDAAKKTPNGSGQSLIRLEGVTKVFVTDEVETHALSGIHLEIREGQYIAIAGPSGCGKSTLLSILGLLDSPTEGSYTLNGHPVAALSAEQRSKIRNREVGFIFQAFNLIGDLTVYENVELPLTYRGMGGAERKKRVQEALERVGMSHRMKHYPSQLSGGQQQRVAVARALGGKPSILLADEPTGNLDSKNGEAVMDLLRELHREGATICMVTHDPRYAAHAERSIHLFDGRIVDETGPDGGATL
jgi:putative ABC transport system ATP-binding protein